MNRELHTFGYGTRLVEYSLFYEQRRTLEISVHPDCAVVVKAPAGTPIADIELKLGKRARWIQKQISYFSQFCPRTPPRRYVGGETHLYLGRQYRLRLDRDVCGSVKLANGFFLVGCGVDDDPACIRKLLDEWYRAKAQVQFNESLDSCWPTFEAWGLPKPRLQIRRMRTRWGSLSRQGTLTLNLELVRAPRECIDYVVTHELCHLKHGDHGPKFYSLLEAVMPNWQRIKHRLELALA